MGVDCRAPTGRRRRRGPAPTTTGRRAIRATAAVVSDTFDCVPHSPLSARIFFYSLLSQTRNERRARPSGDPGFSCSTLLSAPSVSLSLLSLLRPYDADFSVTLTRLCVVCHTTNGAVASAALDGCSRGNSECAFHLPFTLSDSLFLSFSLSFFLSLPPSLSLSLYFSLSLSFSLSSFSSPRPHRTSGFDEFRFSYPWRATSSCLVPSALSMAATYFPCLSIFFLSSALSPFTFFYRTTFCKTRLPKQLRKKNKQNTKNVQTGS